MLVIRLARIGRAKYPTYRVVAAEQARAATGKFVAVLGNYNPHTKDLVLKTDEVKKYLGNGAQPSNTVVKLLMREGVELPAWVKLKTKAPKATEAPESEEVTEAEAASDADTDEAPADQERVAETATEAAAEGQDEVQPLDHTETAADAQADADKAEAGQEAAADAAVKE